MLISFVARRNLFLLRSSTKAFSTEVKTRPVRDANSTSFTTTNRESFERAYPKLAAKQKYHLTMLREKHLPVHRSGANDDRINMFLYLLTGVMLTYVTVLFVDVVRKS